MNERLHLDLVNGARADMIAGALVAVGADLDAAREALAAVGLGDVEVVVEDAVRAGLRAQRLRLLVDGADLAVDVAHAPAPLAPHGRARPGHRHATPRPRLDAPVRTSPLVAAATAASVQGPRGVAGIVSFRDDDDDDDEGPARRRRGQAGARVRRGARGTGRAAGDVERWLAGGDVEASALVDLLRACDLPPVVKAVALKAARRLAEALAAVVVAPRLRGVHAARLLADVVVNAALVDALAPAAITATPIGLAASTRTTAHDEGVLLAASAAGAVWPSPSPWLTEVLAGVPVVELPDTELDVAAVDVAGAALAWSLAQRFGARGVASTTRQGAGAAGVDAPGRALVARALLGAPLPVATRAGAKAAGAAVVVEGRVARDDAGDAMRALEDAGALDVERIAVEGASAAGGASGGAGRVGGDGGLGVRVRALVAAGGAVDDVVRALGRAGAVDVETTWIERRSAGVQEVTVPVGRGRTKASVRVRVLLDGDEVLRIDPDTDDVRAAAARARTSVHAIAAEALEAYARVAGRATTTTGAKPKGRR